jgi:hypothetical protein
MTKLLVKEMLMGQGKSTWMIDTINNDTDLKHSKYIVVLPYLDECHRYAGTIPVGDSKTPKRDKSGDVVYTGSGCNQSGREFKHPSSYNGGKLLDLERLVKRGHDIVTTHATLKNFSKDTLACITDAPYTLVIDEELECVKQYTGLTETRRKMLFNDFVAVEPNTGRLIWIGGDVDTPKHDWVTEVKNLCESGSLFQHKHNIYMWEYPIEFLRAFKKIIVLTYMFEGSMFSAYLKHHNIPYTVDTKPRPSLDWESLITIIDDHKINMIGAEQHSLSSSWYDRRIKEKTQGESLDEFLEDLEEDYVLNTLKNNTYNLFFNICKGQSKENMWTTFKKAIPFIKGKGYARGHVPYNTKAVNDYIHKSNLAYLCNVYMSPIDLEYVSRWDTKPDPDIIALASMLQWMFRSRIRLGEPITVYVPSSRMRRLLQRWIDQEHFYKSTDYVGKIER